MAKKKTEYQTEKPKSTATMEYRKLTDVIQALYFAKGYTNDDIHRRFDAVCRDILEHI